MRRSLFFVLYLICIGVSAQEPSAAKAILNEAEKIVLTKYTPQEDLEYLVLKSQFSKEEVQKIPYADRRIVRIELVYTAFKESEEFSQEELNIKRLNNLIAINPSIIHNKFFDWRIIEQTGCESSEVCKDFFHGFIIYYEPYYTKEETTREIDSITTELKELNGFIQQNQELLKLTTTQIDCEYPTSLYSEEYLTEELDKIYKCDEKFNGLVPFSALMDYKGRVLDVKVGGSLFPCPDRLASALKYILQWKRGLVLGNLQYNLRATGRVSFPLRNNSVQIAGYSIADSLIARYQILAQNSRCVAYEVDTSFTALLPKVPKLEVSSVLQRNSWDDRLIVVDVTGSMFPYTADLLKWVKMNATEDGKTFLFFNDGDDIPTAQKRIGKTGGFYLTRSSDFGDIKETMFSAMRNGGGGDLPENNMEALIHGVSKSGYPQSAIMIADNYSFPRDTDLLSNYKGKLKIILCGTEKGINTDYLNLAKKHGFTLHTLKYDIENLQSITQGQRMNIDGIGYVLNAGGFDQTNPIR